MWGGGIDEMSMLWLLCFILLAFPGFKKAGLSCVSCCRVSLADGVGYR